MFFLDRACHGACVRPGYALYGGGGLKPVVHWSAPVLQVRTIPAPGQSVGYGAIWCADRPTRVATLEVGYAQGFPRTLSGGRGVVYGNGQAAPVIGRVSMNLMTVDVTDLPVESVAVGAQVEIFWTSPDGGSARRGGRHDRLHPPHRAEGPAERRVGHNAVLQTVGILCNV